MTVTDAELEWVTGELDRVFPEVHRHERSVVTQSKELDCRRTRLYGEALRSYVERWDLLTRGTDMVVPERLYSAPLPVVAAYLRSIFQAEGFVSARSASTVVEVDMISERLIRGVQQLLLRFGIFARVGFKPDPRDTRKGCWTVRIQTAGDRRIFADEIGFVDPVKADKLERSFELPGQAAHDTKRLEIARIEPLGAMEVFDIQTESGEYLSGNLRVHNCFILAVDDTMDSILDWYKEEGLIFKGGSGAGVNLSRIRSSKELLSSGGTASGPVSFMRGADASAGTIKSGGATRRAAKMVVLDVDHPDVEEFIETKAREEEKVRVLRDAGFDMDLGGKDIASVQYQNANNSVRVSDEFMRAVERDTKFDLAARMTGETVETVDARALFRTMAQAAWACADPGIQYDGTINDWHTCPESGRITASNPCSEYVHLDNSSCNLASINLLKFLRDDDTFAVEQFRQMTELIITAMDISICFADFPTEKITETTRAYRQLGIGYANLGALLMATGHAYDSDGGRAVAAAITSLMTGTAYRRSAELAAVVGPYDGYKRNATAHKRVMRKHADASHQIRALGGMDEEILAAANKAWDKCVVLGEKNGYRNAQASPAGADRHYRPDDGLRHHRCRAGPGSGQVQEARRRRFHADRQPDRAARPEEHGLPAGAGGGDRRVHRRARARRRCTRPPAGALRGLRLRHGRALHWPDGSCADDGCGPARAKWGHLEDRESARVGHGRGHRVHLHGGLEARAQGPGRLPGQLQGRPAAVRRQEEASRRAEEPAPGARGPAGARRLPKNRTASVTSFSVAGAEGYMTASKYPDDGVGELFLKLGKQGSTLAGVMDAFSMAISISLQYGVPLEKWVEKFTNMRFEPAGITDDPDIRIASSVLDYVFRRLALDHLPYDTRAEMGILSASERTAQLAGEEPDALAEEQDPGEMAQSAPVERPQARTDDPPAQPGPRAGTSRTVPPS